MPNLASFAGSSATSTGSSGTATSSASSTSTYLIAINNTVNAIASVLNIISSRVESISMLKTSNIDEPIQPGMMSPVTQAERIAYSMNESREYLDITLRADEGTEAEIVRRPSSSRINLTYSGSIS
jgi:hypothetical protein